MRVVVIEDHPLYLEAVRNQIARTIERAEIVTAASIAEALSLLSSEPVDLVLLDYALPDGSGLEALRRILAVAGDAPVMVMSGVADDNEVKACLEAGARGFLPKTLEGPLVGMAVALVAKGGTYVPAEIMAGITGRRPAPVQPDDEPAAAPIDATPFSPRETTMLRMLVGGASNKEIARGLGLEEVTVKFYFTRLFQRIGVRNRSQAAVAAVRIGLVEPE